MNLVTVSVEELLISKDLFTKLAFNVSVEKNCKIEFYKITLVSDFIYTLR